MANKLRFDLELREHPYAGSPSTRLEAWGELEIRLVTPTKQLLLYRFEWSLNELADWFGKHQRDLCKESFPQLPGVNAPLPSESLTRAIERCWATGDLIDDSNPDAFENWLDTVREPLVHYMQRHSLLAAMRGSGVPAIIIGCNHDSGEISLHVYKGDRDKDRRSATRDKHWAYQFDMEDFCLSTREELRGFLMKWSVESIDPLVHARANQLVEQLGEDVIGSCCGEA